MKRIIAVIALCAMTLFAASEIRAQKYGIIGGASFTSMQSIDNSSKTGFNIGATAQMRLPLGFSIQPSLLYNSKAADMGVDYKVGYLELPVSVQWGPDLLLFRPFLDVTPFVGYALNSNQSMERMNRFEYGLGLGGGLEVWRFQILCRYNWNFGPLFDVDGALHIDPVRELFADKNFGGVTLSLAFMFGK